MQKVAGLNISIHSLRVEGDKVLFADSVATSISIHSLRVEGDQIHVAGKIADDGFQSTPSVWRETLVMRKRARMCLAFQSTPSVWRETPVMTPDKIRRAISIHSLRVEGDHKFVYMHKSDRGFQSTPSVWRETATKADRARKEALFQSTPSVWRETKTVPVV